MDESGKSSASPSGKDGDGVRISSHGGARGRQSSLLYKVLALVLIGGVAAYLVTLAVRRAPLGDDAAGAGERAADAGAQQPGELEAGRRGSTAATSTGEGQLTARPAPARRDPNDLSNYVAPGQAPAMKEVIERLHDAGIHSGLGAFSPPGTSPPLIGLAVPEDYVLPEGYVRHFQATDDGQRIEPILMYSPDFEFFDAAGRHIQIPPDRVVPPELAPPGLPIRRIEIPAPLEPGSPSR
jgi:hypothetical protein